MSCPVALRLAVSISCRALAEDVASQLLASHLRGECRTCRTRTPSAIGAFALAFGVRSLIRLVRLHRAGSGPELPLTVGPWLSIPMVLVGAILLLRILLRPASPADAAPGP